MKELFTTNEFNKAKSEHLLPMECVVCHKTFYKTKHYIKTQILNPNSKITGEHCSPKCFGLVHRKEKILITKKCIRCGREFETELKNTRERKCCSIYCANSKPMSNETKLKIRESSKLSLKVKNANKQRRKPKIIKICPMCNNQFEVNQCETHRIYCSKSCYKNDKSCQHRKCGSGGCREGSGKSKSGWYKGYYCGSSYELAWIIYHIDHKIKFQRNYEGFDYVYDGKIHKYYPDFIIDNVYYEIKGFKRTHDDYKFMFFPHPIQILFKKDLIDIFEYVISKYGNNFIQLYEGNPYNDKKNKCKHCGKPAKNQYCSRSCCGKRTRNKT